MYHTHMRGTPTLVTSVVSVSDMVSAYERIARRDDNDSSSSSSASSTKNSKSTKCTGSKQDCQLPTNSSHSTSVTVGVAVGVPVAVIIIVLAVVLYVVYKRSKREAEEDNDPDFEGDSEYLPAMHHYPSELNHPYSSDSQDFVEKVFQQPPSDPFANSMDGSKYNVRSATPPGNGGRWYVDPFQLPQETSDSNSLRDFAMRVQSDGFGGYKVAANSRNASSLSLHPDNFSNHTVIRASSRFQESESSESYTSPIDNNHVSNGFATADAYRQPTLPVKESNLATITKDTRVSNKLDESPSNDAFEFEFDNKSGNPQRKSVQVDMNDNYELQDIKDPEHADGSSSNKGENDDYYVSRLSANEEEDIQRMRSIYQVYLDRNKTMKDEQEKQQQQNLNGLPRGETHMDSVNQNPLPSIQIGSEDPTDVQEADQYQDNAVQNALAVNDEDPNEHGLETAQYQGQYPTHDTLAVNGTEAAASNRIASSIYSVAIQPLNYQQQQQSPIYGDSAQNSTSEYTKDFQQQPQQGYPVQAAQNQQWYGAPVPQQLQYNHPQTLETIGELPTPAYLAQSASSHSLTSFKGPNKQQLLQLQTARLNGTALNPVDHPEMFYSPTNDAYYAPQQQGQFIKANENGTVPSPYQLRQSVVMTNPSDLTAKPSYKPAGSFRSVSATNSRNNSLTTQNNSYQYLQQQQQQQHYNSRVSGILEENDVVQPPSVGGILPHSGSQDDLRRQLGSSHNYAIN